MLGSLNTRRDFTYVSDTVNGFLKAAQAGKAVGMTYNLGTGREVWISDLVEMILDMAGEFGVAHKPALESDARRVRPQKSEVLRLLSDNALAREELGWQPEVSLEDGLRQTMGWIAAHLERYRPGVYEL
jgi:dTDP-glucose 4,6-dehydratase